MKKQTYILIGVLILFSGCFSGCQKPDSTGGLPAARSRKDYVAATKLADTSVRSSVPSDMPDELEPNPAGDSGKRDDNIPNDDRVDYSIDVLQPGDCISVHDRYHSGNAFEFVYAGTLDEREDKELVTLIVSTLSGIVIGAGIMYFVVMNNKKRAIALESSFNNSKANMKSFLDGIDKNGDGKITAKEIRGKFSDLF